MMTSPKISVVIPSYNEEKTLPRTLASIRKQHITDYELIVADNNSTDRTKEIAKEYNAVVVPVKKQGYVFALNEGMKHARGEIIAVTDADTYVYPNWLDEVQNTFKNDKVVGVTGAIRISEKSYVTRIGDGMYGLFLAIHFFLGLPHLVGFNFAVRRDALQEVNGLDERFLMSPDVDLGIRLKKAGRLVYNNKMVVIPSMRRWSDGIIKTASEYAKGYFYTIWLRTPPPVTQKVIR